MNKILLSMIVPIYNAEKTLRRCVDSILFPERNDIEIILVDDGSSDSSAEIGKNYADRFEQVIFLHKNNGGVSSARNTGLECARGKWIMFSDSDDSYLPGWLNVVEREIYTTKADLVEFSWNVRTGDNVRDVHCPNIDCTTKLQCAAAVASEIRLTRLNCPYAKLFRKSVIDLHHLRFPEDLSIGEDLVFSFSFALQAESVSVRSEPIYCAYADNSDSLSRKKREMLLEKLLLADSKMIALLEAKDMSKKIRSIYNEALTWSYYRKAYTASKELLKYDYSSAQRIREIKVICKNFDANRSRGCGLKTRIISAPIRWRMAFLIDFMVRRRAKKR